MWFWLIVLSGVMAIILQRLTLLYATRVAKKESSKSSHFLVEMYNRYVGLDYKDGFYVGYCPFHSDVDKTFYVSRQGTFDCTADECGCSGNLVKFISMMENIPEKEAEHLIVRERLRFAYKNGA